MDNFLIYGIFTVSIFLIFLAVCAIVLLSAHLLATGVPLILCAIVFICSGILVFVAVKTLCESLIGKDIN